MGVSPHSIGSIWENGVHSDHYEGNGGISSTLDAIIGPPGTLSSQIRPVSFGFKYNSGVQTWDKLRDHNLDFYPVNDNNGKTTHYIAQFSQNKYAFSAHEFEKHGPFFNPDDVAFAGWKDACESSKSISTGNEPKFSLLIESAQEKLADRILHKYLTDTKAYIGPIGEYGKELSRAATLKASIRDYINSKEGELLISRYGVEAVEYIGVLGKKGTLYATGRLRNGKVVVFTGIDNYQAMAEEAELFGGNLEDILVTD